MQDTNPAAGRPLNLASTARVAMHPIHPMLVPFPIVCFIGALLTDIAYWRTAEMMWADFSAWLLIVGVVMGVLAAHRRADRLSRQPADPRAGAGVAAYGRQCRCAGPRAIQLRSSTRRDAWTSVVPTGPHAFGAHRTDHAVTGWLGWTMVYRHGVGVAP